MAERIYLPLRTSLEGGTLVIFGCLHYSPDEWSISSNHITDQGLAGIHRTAWGDTFVCAGYRSITGDLILTQMVTGDTYFH